MSRDTTNRIPDRPRWYPAAIAAALFVATVPRPGLAETAASPTSTPDPRIDRGSYLVTVAGCNDCHTPLQWTESGPLPDLSRMLSGHPQAVEITRAPVHDDETWGWLGSHTNTAFAGGWGVSFATNLTPDENTGLGIWTEEVFVDTLRTGRHWGQSRPILPPMPWQNYSRMTDEDLGAIYAYLRSIPPISNRVPEPLAPLGSATALDEE